MQVSASVRAVQVPDDNPMHPLYTNIYVVGPTEDGRVPLVIDSGEPQDRYKWMLRGYLAAEGIQQVDLVAITHHHFDHSGNLQWANETLRSQVALPRSSVKLLKGKLPKDEAALRILEDGEVIDAGGVQVGVIFTPGHTVDSVCYFIESEGILFTGDTMLGGSTTTVSDLAAYRVSLQKLLDLPNLQVICPGHGPIINDPRERLTDLLKHRATRDQQILATLQSSSKPQSAWDIMLKVYPDLNKRLRRAATGNVVTHLKAMETEGRVAVRAGKPKQIDPEKARKATAEAKAREAVIKQAEKLKDEQRKAQLRAQQNPPEQWAVPPKYELRD